MKEQAVEQNLTMALSSTLVLILLAVAEHLQGRVPSDIILFGQLGLLGSIHFGQWDWGLESTQGLGCTLILRG